MFKTILIRNASILNLETGKKDLSDIYIENGYIKELSNNISKKAELELDATGYIVTPGLVDTHTHCFYGCGDYFGIDPHIYHLPAGVTYVIDQGSAGADCYELYRKAVLGRNSIRSKAFLNCARIGMPVSSLSGPGELANPAVLDRDAFVNMFEKHRDELLGIKIRVTPNICPVNPKPFIQKCLDIANELDIPLCIHPNQALMDGDELLNMLRPGDIMTHTYHRSKAGILDENGKVKKSAIEAKERGVIFDTGHGLNSLSFDVMRKGIDQGFLPDTLSTDLHNGNLSGPVFSMACTISKFLCMGVSMEDAFRRCTIAPTKIFHLEDKKNSIEIGDMADIAAFSLDTEHHVYHDAEGGVLEGNYRLIPQFTVLRDAVYTPAVDSLF